jgi:hypothetical protein
MFDCEVDVMKKHTVGKDADIVELPDA